MNRVLCSGVVLFIFLASGCAAPSNKTAYGTAGGAALGAGLGAIVGSASGKAGPGIAIGAGAGALAGGLLGNALDAEDEQMAARREELNRQQAMIEENRRLIEELRRRGTDARGSERGVVINLPDVLFEFGKYRLTGDARGTVAEIGEVLQQVSHRSISVEGHTDSIGTVVYNQKLSRNRARAVANELEYLGVAPERIRVRGFGEGSPIASNNSESGRARNRRVEVIIEN